MSLRNVLFILLTSLSFIWVNCTQAATSAELDAALLAPAAHPTDPPNVEPLASIAPLTAQQTLENIKLAADTGRFIDSGFYRIDNLVDFFGAPYVIKPLTIPKDLNIQVISLDIPLGGDGSQPHNEASHPQFSGGKIYLTEMNHVQIAAHLILLANQSGAQSDRMDAELIQRLFGQPTSRTELAIPEQRKNDDSADANGAVNASQSNGHWVNYQTVSGSVFKNILFRIAEDGSVAELQIYTGIKQ